MIKRVREKQTRDNMPKKKLLVAFNEIFKLRVLARTWCACESSQGEYFGILAIAFVDFKNRAR
jgi:hypothetical protein